VTGITLDGNAMTAVIQSGTNDSEKASIFQYQIDTGTTANFVFSAGFQEIEFSVLAIYDANATATSTASGSCGGFNCASSIQTSTDLVVPTNGVAVAFGSLKPQTETPSWSDGGITQDAGSPAYLAGTIGLGIGGTATGAHTYKPKFIFSTDRRAAIAAAAWGP
jgi:hypothetical protein